MLPSVTAGRGNTVANTTNLFEVSGSNLLPLVIGMNDENPIGVLYAVCRIVGHRAHTG